MDEKDYEDYLNEVYGDVDICGLFYPAGSALRDVDPAAFDIGYADWEAEERDRLDEDDISELDKDD